MISCLLKLNDWIQSVWLTTYLKLKKKNVVVWKYIKTYVYGNTPIISYISKFSGINYIRWEITFLMAVTF